MSSFYLELGISLDEFGHGQGRRNALAIYEHRHDVVVRGLWLFVYFDLYDAWTRLHNFDMTRHIRKIDDKACQ